MTARIRNFWVYAAQGKDLLIGAAFPFVLALLFALTALLVTPVARRPQVVMVAAGLLGLAAALFAAGLARCVRISRLLRQGRISNGVITQLVRRAPWYARHARTKQYVGYVFETPDGPREARLSVWSANERWSWLRKDLSVRVVSNPDDPRQHLLLLPEDEPGR